MENAVDFLATEMTLFPKSLHHIQNRCSDMALGFGKMVRDLSHSQRRMVLHVLEDL